MRAKFQSEGALTQFWLRLSSAYLLVSSSITNGLDSDILVFSFDVNVLRCSIVWSRLPNEELKFIELISVFFFLNLFAAKQKLRIFGNLCKNFGDCKSIRHQLSKIVTKQPKALGEIVFSVITKISDLSLFSWLIVVYFFLFFKMPFVHCSWVL